MPKKEGDFIDVPMKVVSVMPVAGHRYRIDAVACYQGQIAGLMIEVAQSFANDFYDVINKNEEIKVTETRFLSKGTESDVFIKMISELYFGRSSSRDLKMRELSRFDCVAFQAAKQNIKTTPVKLKLLAQQATESEDDYFEIYLNLNLPVGRIEIAEKDIDYRKPLVRHLAG